MDALIIGGGPAGGTCALWLKLLGFEPALIEARDRFGGVLRDSPYGNPWVTGMGDVTGAEFADRIHDHITDAGVPVFCNTRVVSVRQERGGFGVELKRTLEKRLLSSRFLVLATGISPASGGYSKVPGFFIGPGRAVMDADFTGQRVAILGGGDNGFEHYGLVRARGAASICIFARSVRAQRQFVDTVPAGDLRVGSYKVDPLARTVDGDQFDSILVFYGYSAEMGYLGAIDVARDREGYISTDRETAGTSVAGIYAVGDLAAHGHPCCLTAMADGVAAAKAIAARLEAEKSKRIS